MALTRILHTLTPKNRLQTAVVTAIVVGSLTTGVSYASISDGGVINGCVNNKTGVLKVITSVDVPPCPKNSTSLNWSQGIPSGTITNAQQMVGSVPLTEGPTAIDETCPTGKVAISGNAFYLANGVQDMPLAVEVAQTSSFTSQMEVEVGQYTQGTLASGAEMSWEMVCADVSS